MKDNNKFNLDQSIENNDIKIKVKNNNLINSDDLKLSSNLTSTNSINFIDKNENDKNVFNSNQNLQIYSTRTTNILNPNQENLSIDSKILLNDRKNKNLNQNNFIFKDFIFFKGEKMKLLFSPLDYLKNINSLIIEQKLDILEIVSGCENPNKYHIYTPSPKGEKKYLFKCYEISTCCYRNFCPSNSRKFDLIIEYPIKFNIKNSKKIAFLSKNFNCKLLNCCCSEPELKVTFLLNNNKNIYLGCIKEISNGLFKCDPIFIIYNNYNKILFKIIINYKQIGFFCKCNSLGKCYEVDFLIFKGNDNFNIDKPIGIIHKYYQGLSELVGDSDAYIINFPNNINVYEKILLISSVIMIDYHYFESNSFCECNFV